MNLLFTYGNIDGTRMSNMANSPVYYQYHKLGSLSHSIYLTITTIMPLSYSLLHLMVMALDLIAIFMFQTLNADRIQIIRLVMGVDLNQPKLFHLYFVLTSLPRTGSEK